MEFKNNLRALLVIVLVSLSSNLAIAKDLTQRLGIGFKNNTSQSLPSLALVYYAAKDFAFTSGTGINTEKNNSAFQLHAGVRKVIFTENNLNFYTGVQVGVASYENLIDGRNSGIEILGVGGTEFFLPGLENLGFSLEAGFAVSSIKDTRFRTIGDDPLRAGIIFYF